MTLTRSIYPAFYSCLSFLLFILSTNSYFEKQYGSKNPSSKHWQAYRSSLWGAVLSSNYIKTNFILKFTIIMLYGLLIQNIFL